MLLDVLMKVMVGRSIEEVIHVLKYEQQLEPRWEEVRVGQVMGRWEDCWMPVV